MIPKTNISLDDEKIIKVHPDFRDAIKKEIESFRKTLSEKYELKNKQWFNITAHMNEAAEHITLNVSVPDEEGNFSLDELIKEQNSAVLSSLRAR